MVHEKILPQQLDILEFNKLIKDNEDIHNEDLTAAIKPKLGDGQFPATIITAFPDERKNKDTPLTKGNRKCDICNLTIKYHMVREKYKSYK